MDNENININWEAIDKRAKEISSNKVQPNIQEQNTDNGSFLGNVGSGISNVAKGIGKSIVSTAIELPGMIEYGLDTPSRMLGISPEKFTPAGKNLQTITEQATGLEQGSLTERKGTAQQIGGIVGDVGQMLLPSGWLGGLQKAGKIGKAGVIAGETLIGGLQGYTQGQDKTTDTLVGAGQGLGYEALNQIPILGKVSKTAGLGKKIFSTLLQEAPKGVAVASVPQIAKMGQGEEFNAGEFLSTAGITAGLGTAMRSAGDIFGKIKGIKEKPKIDEVKDIISGAKPIDENVLVKQQDILNTVRKNNEKINLDIQTDLQPDLDRVINKAIKPLLKEIGTSETSKKQFKEDLGKILNIVSKDDAFVKGVDETNAMSILSANIPEVKKKIFAPITKAIEEVGENAVMNTQRVYDDFNKTIDGIIKGKSYNRTANATALKDTLEKFKDDLQGETNISFERVQDYISDLNKDLNDVYIRQKQGVTPTLTEKSKFLLAEILRDELDKQIDTALGKNVGIKDIKDTYRAVKNVEKAISKRAVTLDRQNQVKLGEEIAMYLNAKNPITNPLGFITEQATGGIMKKIRSFNDPNYILTDYIRKNNLLLKNKDLIDEDLLSQKFTESARQNDLQNAEKILSTIDEVKTYKTQQEQIKTQEEANKPISEEDTMRNEARQRIIEEETLKRTETKRKQIEFEEKQIKEYAEKNNLDYLKDEDYVKAKEGYAKQVEEGKNRIKQQEEANKIKQQEQESMRAKLPSFEEMIDRNSQVKIQPETLKVNDDEFKKFLDNNSEIVDDILSKNSKLANDIFSDDINIRHEANGKIIEEYNNVIQNEYKKVEKQIINELKDRPIIEYIKSYNDLNKNAKNIILNAIGASKKSNNMPDYERVKNVIKNSKGTQQNIEEARRFIFSLEENIKGDDTGYVDDILQELAVKLENRDNGKIFSNPYILSGVGTLYGFEKDENGKWRFNPEKAMQGMAMGTIAGAGMRAMSKKPYNSSRLGMFGGEGTGKVSDDLYEEARKYKTKEEFVKGEPTFYHGTEKILKLDAKKPLKEQRENFINILNKKIKDNAIKYIDEEINALKKRYNITETGTLQGDINPKKDNTIYVFNRDIDIPANTIKSFKDIEYIAKKEYEKYIDNINIYTLLKDGISNAFDHETTTKSLNEVILEMQDKIPLYIDKDFKSTLNDKELGIAEDIFKAYEINSIAPHGYMSNSKYRDAIMWLKSNLIKKAIEKIKDTKTDKINVNAKDNIVYFNINGRQISFHGKYLEDIKEGGDEWVGVKTLNNPLSLNKNQYNRLLKQKDILTEIENTTRGIIKPDYVFNKDIDVYDILNKIKESIKSISSKYNVPEETIFKEIEKSNIFRDINTKKEYSLLSNVIEELGILPFKQGISVGYADKKSIEKITEEVKNKYDFNLNYLKKRADEIKEEISKYKTKTSKTRLNLLNEESKINEQINKLENDTLKNKSVNIIISNYKKIISMMEDNENIYKAVDKIRSQLEQIWEEANK